LKADKEIKQIKHQVSKVIPNGGYHKVLMPNATTSLDLIEDTPIFCKIKLQDMRGPLKLYIEFTSQTEADFKIYISDKIIEPSEVNSLFIIQN